MAADSRTSTHGLMRQKKTIRSHSDPAVSADVEAHTAKQSDEPDPQAEKGPTENPADQAARAFVNNLNKNVLKFWETYDTMNLRDHD